jgi:integrase/recombinase XerD
MRCGWWQALQTYDHGVSVERSRCEQRRCPHLPLCACWCSSPPVTHGDVWLSFLLPVSASHLPTIFVLRAAVSAYLGRYRGETRLHTESDLGVFLGWCIDQDLAPLAAARLDIERYLRWLQEVRRYQPSTVSRRLSVVVGFYRVCVIDGVLPHSPADYVRRPPVPAESPALGLGHLQFEALITTARLSTNPNDFGLIAMLGLLGLRIFEACGADVADLGEEYGHRVLRVRGKGDKVVLVPLPPAVARAIDRAVDGRTDGPILRNTLGIRMDRHAATRRLKHLAATAGVRMPRMHPHMLRHILSAL